MLGELVEVVTKLFEVSDRLKQSKDEDRQRIANYFQKVGDCLLGIAEELGNGNPHHGKWGELQEYAKTFPKVISEVIGKALPMGQIAVELEKGTIQAAEWIGPHDDFQLNLHKAGAKYYYYPGWWEPSTTFDVQVNAKAWEELPPGYKRIFEAVCYETYTKILSEYDRRNAQMLGEIRNLESSGNIKILPFPNEVLQAAQVKTEELLKLYDANQQFKKAHDEWEGFKTQMK
jgi:TRAP-type mannitol/chloroaromatic compound transport system substrate-binding protein